MPSLGRPFLIFAVLVSLLITCRGTSAAAQVTVAPTGDPELSASLAASVNLLSLESAAFARSAMELEQQRLTEIAKAFSYLHAVVDLSFDSGIVVVNVSTGPSYRIGSIQVSGAQDAGAPEFESDIHHLISSAVGLPARADIVRRLASEVLWRSRAASFPYARINSAVVVPDAATASASVVVEVVMGQRAALGEVTFSRRGSLNIEHLKSLVPFDAGAPYSPKTIDELDSALISLPLVRRTDIDLAPEVGNTGRVSVDVKLRTFADRAILDRNKALGITIIFVVLGLLVLRQVTMATGHQARSAPVITTTVTAGLLSIAAAYLVVDRAISFAQITP